MIVPPDGKPSWVIRLRAKVMFWPPLTLIALLPATEVRVLKEQSCTSTLLVEEIRRAMFVPTPWGPTTVKRLNVIGAIVSGALMEMALGKLVWLPLAKTFVSSSVTALKID